MPLFQNSILKKHLQSLNTNQTQQAYQNFRAYFHQPDIQNNIRAAKEEQFQEGFLRELFVKILGYTINPEKNYTLTTEFKNQKGAKKADGAIIDSQGHVKAVIELKSTKTIDLDNIENQAFGYKNNQKNCRYVITSNFEKIRFYIDNAIDFMEWNLFNLNQEKFNELYSLLHQQYLLIDTPLTLKNSSLIEEESITKKLYAEYSHFRKELFKNLIANNPNIEKLTLFKKTQKLLDRFLFLFFAEDKLLIPANSVRGLLNSWDALKQDPLAPQQPLYHRFKSYFYYLNFGFKNKTHEIFAYNGGLFAPDEIIDNLVIDDDILYDSCATLSDYDYDSDIDVNILGHIFEHSLNEVEELESNTIDSTPQKITKRKKDGIFYTPRYITKYIIDNTLGVLCDEKKNTIGLKEDDFIAKLTKTKQKPLLEKLNTYKTWLLQLTVVDPACGSGAFLNQALEFLIAEHRFVAELEKKLTGSSLVFDIENSILENNLFGVDINEESVEIAKLSLWLRTAMPNRKLTSLSNNIKCGNSLIDDASVAGDKTFNWPSEFKQVFDKGGFDVVIGNPPWGAKLDKRSSTILLKKYPLIPSKIKDTYLYFMLMAFKINKPNGMYGLITPNTWLLINSTSAFRKEILSYDIKEINDHGDNVFNDAIVESCTLILKNKKEIDGNIKAVRSKNGNELLNHYVNKEYWLKDSLHRIVLDIQKTTFDFLDRIESISTPFSENSEIIWGIKPYQVGHGKPSQTQEMVNNRIYHSNIKHDESWKELVVGADVQRYQLNYNKNQYIKYGKCLMYPSDVNKITAKKILLRQTSSDLKAVLDSNHFYPQNSLFIITSSSIDLEYLLVLINSKLLNFFYQSKSLQDGKVFAEIKPSIIKSLPIIAEPKNKEVFIEKAHTMLSLNTKIQTLITKFKTYFCNKYQLQKISSKLDNWHTLSFAEFIAELNKAIKTNKGKALSKKDEFDWIDLFEDNKKQAQTLQQQITQTDQQIDQMVYSLYQLTPEEIAIVEGKA